VRLTFALIILMACIRVAFTLGSSSPTLSEGGQLNSGDVARRDDLYGMNAIEAMTDSPMGSPDDPGRQFFRRIMVEVAHHDYEAAAAGFRLFLELHPTSSLFTQADYWLGVCEYQLKHYKAAIDALDQALSRTPFNPTLAAAVFLRKANSYAHLGDARQSRRLLELIVVQFPTTEEAAEARQTLLAQQRRPLADNL